MGFEVFWRETMLEEVGGRWRSGGLPGSLGAAEEPARLKNHELRIDARRKNVFFHELGCAGEDRTLPGAALFRVAPAYEHSLECAFRAGFQD